MTKKDVWVLILPSLLTAWLAVYALRFSFATSPERFLANDPEIVKMHQKDFDDFVAKVQSGDLQLTPDKIIELLRDDRKVEEENRRLISLGSRLTRVLGWLGITAVVLHVCLVLRFSVERKKPMPN